MPSECGAPVGIDRPAIELDSAKDEERLGAGRSISDFFGESDRLGKQIFGLFELSEIAQHVGEVGEGRGLATLFTGLFADFQCLLVHSAALHQITQQMPRGRDVVQAVSQPAAIAELLPDVP